MPDIVYFSSVSETTHRFVSKLRVHGTIYRIPVLGEWTMPVPGPYVLITPTYGDAHGKRHIPHQVRKFLGEAEHRAACIGVIGTGNRNFGREYGRAAHIIADKLDVPLLYMFELAGDPEDVGIVQEKLAALDDSAQAGSPTP